MGCAAGSAASWRRPYILGYLNWGEDCREDTPRKIRTQWPRWIFLAPDGFMSGRPARKAIPKRCIPTIYADSRQIGIFLFPALELRRD